MQYIHIKNLDKYHPNFKDRNLIWCKVYFTMINGDPEFEMLCEIDQWRFVKLIMLEIQTKKPVPIDEDYLKRKGFDLKKRPISLTLQMIHNFVDVCIQEIRQCGENRSVEVDIEVDKEVEKNKNRVGEFFSYFLLKTKKELELTPDRRALILKRLDEGRTVEDLKKAVDNFMMDDWSDRHKFIDLVYCIGVRNKIDNLDKWLSVVPKNQPVPKLVADPDCKVCGGAGKVLNGEGALVRCACVKEEGVLV